MTVQWISAGKDKCGLKYREHTIETVGIGRNKRPLRYYKAVFKLEGKTVSDVFGWETDFPNGRHEIEKIALELRINRKSKVPPFAYREMIEENDKVLAEKKAHEKALRDFEQERDTTRFSVVFERFLDSKPQSRSFTEMKGFYLKWLQPILGEKRLDEITLAHLQMVQQNMEKSGRAPRTIKTSKEVVRQLYNYAQEHGIYTGPTPYANYLKKLKLNNRREAYYTPEQAWALLAALETRSLQTYRMALLSLNTGMRFGEIAGLLWQHVDIVRRTILVVDPKNGENRTVYLVDKVLGMFQQYERGENDQLVFPCGTGERMTKVSNTFPKVLSSLGFNRGVTDRRLRLGFHSLRHTAASWMANQGVEMHIIAKVLGHKTLAMTMRYSHINDKTVKDAMAVLENQI